MHEMRALLDRFWIVKAQDKDLYFSVKRALPVYKRFIHEQLGWTLIVNESVIKLEKVPPRSMAWMGIDAFSEPLDYCLLCALLLYLEDMDDGEQFLLSELTAALSAYLQEFRPVEWTRYPHRKSLVRVLRYAQSNGLLLAYDGSSESFSGSEEQELLYENTGLSRHFPVHFDRDTAQCRSVEDFEAFSWEDAERGLSRIHRVYRQLALAPGLYWTKGDEADYEYVKNQRQWVGQYLDEAIGGELHIHRNGTFFVLEEQEAFGRCHPWDSGLSDAVLLLCADLREDVAAGVLVRREDDRIALSNREFRQYVSSCRERWGAGWSREMRGLTTDKLCERLHGYMTDWMLLESLDDENVWICPAAGKWTGRYPKDYKPDDGEGENEDEPMEDA